MQAPPERHDFTSRRTSIFVVASLATMMVAYALLFGWLSLETYRAYDMHALDMGNMGQAAWNTLHGHPFFFTNMRLPYNIEAWNTTTRLSFHVEAIFPLISLVYVLYSGPESLLVLQTVALALGALPVYLLARRHLESAALGLVFALAYLLFPSLQAMNLYEFHPVALATPLLLAAFLYAVRRQYALFALCCALAAGTKEEIGLVVGLLGVYVALAQGERRLGWSVAALGALWSLFAALIIEHHYRQPGSVTYLHARYGYLGHGLHGALTTLFRHPMLVFENVFTWAKVGYLIRLLIPLGLLALFSPATLLLGAPTLALNLASTEPHMYSALGQNSAELIAVVMISAILGARRALALLSLLFPPMRARLVLALWVLLASVFAQHVFGFAPGSSNWSVPVVARHQLLADKFVRMIPANAPVSTQDQLDPHLSSRHYLYLFEDNGRLTTRPFLPLAQFIFLDVSAPTYPLPSSTLHDRALSYIHRSGWAVVAADDGLLLIKRGSGAKTLPGRFYTYMHPGNMRADHGIHAESGALEIIGYSYRETDRSNEHPARLAYTVFLRPRRRVRVDMQPVVFAIEGERVVQCAKQPLGLAWLPSTHWQAGTDYVVRMDPIQFNSQPLGSVRLYLEMAPTRLASRLTCDRLWSQRGRIWNAGVAEVGL